MPCMCRPEDNGPSPIIWVLGFELDIKLVSTYPLTFLFPPISPTLACQDDFGDTLCTGGRLEQSWGCMSLSKCEAGAWTRAASTVSCLSCWHLVFRSQGADMCCLHRS